MGKGGFLLFRPHNSSCLPYLSGSLENLSVPFKSGQARTLQVWGPKVKAAIPAASASRAH